jgi:hypothetical protein
VVSTVELHNWDSSSWRVLPPPTVEFLRKALAYFADEQK